MNLRDLFAVICLFAFSACGGGANGPVPEATTTVDSTQATQASPPAWSAGDYEKTISAGGAEREYTLHIPPAYDGSKALPLVLVLHGMGGSAKAMVMSTGMSQKADQENFIVAYLNGTDIPPRGWNAGIINEPALLAIDDVGFVRSLIKQLESDLKVDAQRIYAAGFSNGGMMAHRLGAELSDLLAGVAVVEGIIATVQDDGTTLKIPNAAGPIPVIIIHGKADANLPYDGGQGLHSVVSSVAESVAFWTEANGCQGAPLTKIRPDGKVGGTDYSSCLEGSEVRLLTTSDGRHEWPTLENPAKLAATEVIWKFFSEHSKVH